MYNVAFATGSRADYGIMRKYLYLLHNNKNINLNILTTGALLDKNYGHQVDLIYKDGFNVAIKVDIDLDTNSNKSILRSMSIGLKEFGEYFHQIKYDLLVLLGDRYEILPIAIAAAMNKIPILHIHGGEATFSNYDEFIRHSITKMSTYHFTSTEDYRRRVIQLGEKPDRVYNLGALGAENCKYIDERNVPNSIKSLSENQYFVILFHPETLSNVSEEFQIMNLLEAISEFTNYTYVFIGSNADTNSNIIRNIVQKYVNNNNNAIYYENLHSDAYHYLVKNSICLIGNSSSGIIEAPTLGVYTINIGNRQDGRVRGNSIIDTECKKENITNAINTVLTLSNKINIDNPYFQEDSANKYFLTTLKILSELSNNSCIPKCFYDLNFDLTT